MILITNCKRRHVLIYREEDGKVARVPIDAVVYGDSLNDVEKIESWCVFEWSEPGKDTKALIKRTLRGVNKRKAQNVMYNWNRRM